MKFNEAAPHYVKNFIIMVHFLPLYVDIGTKCFAAVKSREISDTPGSQRASIPGEPGGPDSPGIPCIPTNP
jgi:hypothetical protein